jgi:hypothetical protein
MVARHDFGPEGRAYVRSYLEANAAHGKLLGALLLAAHQIDEGDVWAFVPAQLPQERQTPLTDFEDGYIYPDPESRSARQASNDGWLREVCKRAHGSWLLCVEDAFGRPSDPFVAKRNDPMFFCGDSVYWYETADEADARTRTELGGALWEPTVGIVTVIPPSGRGLNRQTLKDPVLGELAASAAAIVIGAWDTEGLIFWEPSSVPR